MNIIILKNVQGNSNEKFGSLEINHTPISTSFIFDKKKEIQRTLHRKNQNLNQRVVYEIIGL